MAKSKKLSKAELEVRRARNALKKPKKPRDITAEVNGPAAGVGGGFKGGQPYVAGRGGENNSAIGSE